MRRLERLVNLVAALLDTERPLDRSDIAYRVPGYSSDPVAFRRAFERDKDTLRTMGIPLLTEPLDPKYPDHGDGYRIPRDRYEMRDPGLSVEELHALHTAASAVHLKDQTAASALWKLGGTGTNVARMQDVELPHTESLETVFAAVSERRTISFAYKGKRREVEPHRLTFRNGRWFVHGLDQGAADQRTYRLDRVDGPVLIGPSGAFVTPPPVTQARLPAWQMGDGPSVQARLLVDADQADWTIEQTGVEAVEQRLSGGSVILTLRVSNRDSFRSFVLGLLDHGEILDPPELREDMRQWLTHLATAS